MIPAHGASWTAVGEGTRLPELTFEVTRSTLAKDVVGTRDLYPIHHDHVFAQANGARDVFLNTMWYQGLLGRYVNEWGGYESFVRKMSVRMSAHGCPGDTLTVRGTVLRTRQDEQGRRLVDLDVRIRNQTDAETVTSLITLELSADARNGDDA
jgi:acyl dehydratase